MALNPEGESAHLQEIQMFDRRGEGLSTRSVLVDHHLPGITGLELIYSLKIKSTIPKITAAILISSDYDILNRVSQRYEIDGILRKPIARSALKEVLELVFAGKPRIPYFKRREHR